jgi:hypothetical protein
MFQGAWRVPRSRRAGGWVKPWSPPYVPTRTPRPRLEHYGRWVTAELDVSQSVILNSTGAGFVQLNPDGMTEWMVDSAAISTGTGPTDQVTAILYRAGVFPHRIINQTGHGGGDIFDFAVTLRPGDSIICVWQGGHPQDTATLNLSGTLRARVL